MKKIIALAKRAKLRWLRSPCAANKTELNRLDALTKRAINEAKSASWMSFISSLESAKSNNIWQFTKKMIGSAPPPSTNYPICLPSGVLASSTQEEANLFLHHLAAYTLSLIHI